MSESSNPIYNQKNKHKNKRGNEEKDGTPNKKLKKRNINLDEDNKDLNSIPIANKGKVLAIFSNKGGTGKTTLVKEIIGKLIYSPNSNFNKILVIDSDSQLNLTSMFITINLQNKFSNCDWFDLFKLNGVNRIYSTWCNGKQLDLLFSNEEKPDIVYSLGQTNTVNLHMETLNNNILKLKNLYDIILIDMSPTLNTINKSLLAISDEVITTMLPDEYSCQGLTNLCNFIIGINSQNSVRVMLKRKSLVFKFFVLSMTHFANDLTKVENHYRQRFSSIGKQFKLRLLAFIPTISRSVVQQSDSLFLQNISGEKSRELNTQIDRIFNYLQHDSFQERHINVENASILGNSYVYAHSEGGGFRINSNLDGRQMEHKDLFKKSIGLNSHSALSLCNYIKKLFSKSLNNYEVFILSNSDLQQLNLILSDNLVIEDILNKERTD